VVRLGIEGDGLPVDSDGGFVAPARHAEIKRKPDRFGDRHFELERVTEGIIGNLCDFHAGTVDNFRLDFARRVQRRGQSAVTGGRPHFLGEVGPTHRVIVLAAAIDAQRAVREHGSAVVDSRGLVLLVQLHLIGGGEIVQRLEVGRECGGKGVERKLFATVVPCGITSDAAEHLEAVHVFDNSAGFEALPRVGKARPAIFVSPEAASGHLSVHPHDGVIDVDRGGVVGRVLRLHGIFRRLAKTFGKIHVVPVGNTLGPCGGVPVQFVGQIEQPGIAGSVVEPVDAFKIVAGAHSVPITADKILIGKGELIFEIPRHEIDGAPIAAVFVITLHGVENRHVRPEIGLSLQRGAKPMGAEKAIRRLRSKDCIDPALGIGGDSLISQHITKVTEASQPVGNLFPPVFPFPLWICPAASFKLAPGRKLLQMPGQPVGFESEHLMEPAPRRDAPNRQPGHRHRGQRCAVGSVLPFAGISGRLGNLHHCICPGHHRSHHCHAYYDNAANAQSSRSVTEHYCLVWNDNRATMCPLTGRFISQAGHR